MTKNLDLNGLQSIADNYDLFYIDLWGVIHNGIKLHEQAITVLKELLKKDKDFVLLTNAPRPNKTVRNFLQKIGIRCPISTFTFLSEIFNNFSGKDFGLFLAKSKKHTSISPRHIIVSFFGLIICWKNSNLAFEIHLTVLKTISLSSSFAGERYLKLISRITKAKLDEDNEIWDIF